MKKINSENILNQSLDQVMADRFGRYSKYIIQDRALPDARDGLKPVQRRIIYSMQDLGLFSNRPFKKSARVVGDVIGKYHPHGDSSIYEAMVRMSQDWKMQHPLIEMHGNNGSIDDDPAAAMRYTEARLSPISDMLITNLKKNTVSFSPNFDDTEKEPTVLPSLLPNLLINGAKGIAAGYATEIPPHNLNEVVDGIIAKIKNPQLTLENLLQFIKGPDFPTGGIIQGNDGIYQAFERGKGRVVVRSKYELEATKNGYSIVISEIPYGVIKSKLVRQIDELRFNNILPSLSNVRDQSDRHGISIHLELTNGANPEALINYLLTKTDLQIYYNYNVVAIKNKTPKLMSLMTIIEAYLEHQNTVQRKALNFDLAKAKRRLEIILGLIKVSQIVNKVIKAIREVKGSRQGVVNLLMQRFSFTNLQAQAIADLRLYRLSQTDQNDLEQEQKELTIEIANIEQILESPSVFNKYLIAKLRQLKKDYGQLRKTLIETEIEQLSVTMEQLIQHQDVWIGISKDGYIKRFSNKAYEANDLTKYGLKENDQFAYFSLTHTKSKLLIFTNLGNYIFLPVHKIIETKFKEIGKHINDYAAILPNEYIVSVIVVENFDLPIQIILVSQNGKAKNVKIDDFKVSRINRSYQAFKLAKDDRLIGAKISNGTQQLIIVAKNGKAVRYHQSNIPTQGLNAGGAKAIVLKDGQKVSAFAIVNNNDILGLVSNRGGLKRIRVKQIIAVAKTSQGKNIIKALKQNPHIINDLAVINLESEAIFYTSKGWKNYKFKDVDLTSVEEGMSLLGPSQNFGSTICEYAKVSDNNEWLMINNNVSEEEKFLEAEKAIADATQLSLDDILNKLK